MEEKVFKPKLRVTLLEENGSVINDRLVDATSEFYIGPKVQHKGPIRLEVTLTNSQDIEQFKNYLDKLVGNLPIKAPSAGRGRPSGSTINAKELDSPREDILANVTNLAKEGKTQHEIIKYLRELGFVFILTEDFLHYFSDFEFNHKDVGDPTDNHQFPDSIAWMVRCIKRAKDPQADKFDPMILFGFNINNQKSTKIVPYLFKERGTVIRASRENTNLSFNTVEFTKFPKYMLEEERLKFSTEQRQLLQNKNKKPSKFFIRWYKDVIFPDSIKDKIKEIIKREDKKTTTLK